MTSGQVGVPGDSVSAGGTDSHERSGTGLANGYDGDDERWGRTGERQLDRKTLFNTRGGVDGWVWRLGKDGHGGGGDEEDVVLELHYWRR